MTHAFAPEIGLTDFGSSALRIGYQAGEDADDEEDADDGAEGDDEDASDDGEKGAGDGDAREKPIELSTWLTFGVPRLGDRFMLDWRHQWDIVHAGRTIGEAFCGNYEMSKEKLGTLKTRDAPAWRRFLREALDPRFDRAL